MLRFCKILWPSQNLRTLSNQYFLVVLIFNFLVFSLLIFLTLSFFCAKKGEKNDIRHIKDDNNMYQQCLYIYDIVYLNGQVLTNLPLKERILKLREVVPNEIPGT